MSDDLYLPLTELTGWTARVLGAAGLRPEDAGLGARDLVRADARGVRTHGLALLPAYLGALSGDHIRAGAEVQIDDDGDRIIADAQGAMGQVALARIAETILSPDTSRAVNVVAIRNVAHLGALGVAALTYAEAGRIAVLTQNTQPLVGLPGSVAKGIGNNPFAFAAPLPGRDPIVFDAAASAVSMSRILAHKKDGHPIPEGWGLGPDGAPTTDPAEALSGVLLPFGGHKSIAIAMLFELLAGSLNDMRPHVAGGALVGNGAFLMVIDPAAFVSPDAYGRHAQDWAEQYLASGPEARLPGQAAAERERHAQVKGVPVTRELADKLAAQGRDMGLPLPGTN